jgi:hypothetical protein
MFRYFAALAVAVCLLVVPTASAQTPVPLVSTGQDPALALIGDQDGAKWLLGLGDWGLSFKSDNADTTAIPNIADTLFGGRTYKPKVRFSNNGNVKIAGDLIASGKVLSEMPHVAVHRATALSLPNNTVTDVTWDGTGEDTWNMHGPSNLELITIPYDGVWSIEALASFGTSATGVRTAWIKKDEGATDELIGRDVAPAVSASSATVLNVQSTRRFVAGDQIKLSVLQDSGGALNLTSDNTDPYAFTHLTATMLSS